MLNENSKFDEKSFMIPYSAHEKLISENMRIIEKERSKDKLIDALCTVAGIVIGTLIVFYFHP